MPGPPGPVMVRRRWRVGGDLEARLYLYSHHVALKYKVVRLRVSIHINNNNKVASLTN